MEFIFDILAEIIIEPIVEGYALAMMLFSDNNKKINEDTVKGIVLFECAVLIILFIVGGIMLDKSEGASLWGKVMLFSSIAVSVLQIATGIVLKSIRKKDRKK